MLTKLDYAIGGFAGFFTGIFLIPMLYNLGVREPFVLMALPLAAALLFAFGVWLGKFLSRWVPLMGQLAKFAAVGFLNTALDFGILNLLSAATGVTAGVVVGGVNIPGFSVAVFNSFFWNKLWVFRGRQHSALLQDFPQFFAVTFIGLLINSGIIVAVTTFVEPAFGLSDQAWLNTAKAGATIVSFIWNFIGYKFFVFRR
ncbi:MAG: GtrA family protein [Candidatus Sungbacteria bacterium]|nr:GtrA family protein [Candidatus Sungbacteria bacterium]